MDHYPFGMDEAGIDTKTIADRTAMSEEPIPKERIEAMKIILMADQYAKNEEDRRREAMRKPVKLPMEQRLRDLARSR